MRKKDKELQEEKDKVEILKKPCTSSCKHKNKVRSNLYVQPRVSGEKDVQGVRGNENR